MMIRGIGFLMGASLLLIVGVLGPLREEESRAYWVLMRSYKPPYGLNLTTPDQGIIRQLVTTQGNPIEDHFHLCPQNNLVFYQVFDFYTQFSNLEAIRLTNKQHSIVLEDVFLTNIQPSPNREWVVFIASEVNGDSTLYLLGCQTQDLQALMTVSFSKDQSLLFNYSWSPDSQWIVFYAHTDSEVSTYLASIDGQVTEPICSGRCLPLWSTDNTEIMYVDRDGEEFALYRRTLLTWDRVRLTESAQHGVKAWLPDNWIIFVRSMESRRGDNTEMLYRMRFDGSDVAPLVNSDDIEVYLGAGTDGQWVYSSVHMQAGDQSVTALYRTNPMSLERQHLVTLEYFDLGWLSADNDRIIFQGRYQSEVGLSSMKVDGTDIQLILPLELPPSSWRSYFAPDSEWMYVLVLSNTSQRYDYLSLLRVNIITGQIQELPKGEPIDFRTIEDKDWQPWEISVMAIFSMMFGMIPLSLMYIGWRE